MATAAVIARSFLSRAPAATLPGLTSALWGSVALEGAAATIIVLAQAASLRNSLLIVEPPAIVLDRVYRRRSGFPVASVVDIYPPPMKYNALIDVRFAPSKQKNKNRPLVCDDVRA
ncbi:hypothetical protein WME90_28205 [Sorangium sp. So ce375]|uniref:hypothetical protein n=1 Tax=Sorangium sp. So ce375 TaxID=3133306 RepID=UPI003F5AE85F